MGQNIQKHVTCEGEYDGRVLVADNESIKGYMIGFVDNDFCKKRAFLGTIVGSKIDPLRKIDKTIVKAYIEHNCRNKDDDTSCEYIISENCQSIFHDTTNFMEIHEKENNDQDQIEIAVVIKIRSLKEIRTITKKEDHNKSDTKNNEEDDGHKNRTKYQNGN